MRMGHSACHRGPPTDPVSRGDLSLHAPRLGGLSFDTKGSRPITIVLRFAPMGIEVSLSRPVGFGRRSSASKTNAQVSGLLGGSHQQTISRRLPLGFAPPRVPFRRSPHGPSRARRTKPQTGPARPVLSATPTTAATVPHRAMSFQGRLSARRVIVRARLLRASAQWRHFNSRSVTSVRLFFSRPIVIRRLGQTRTVGHGRLP
jgi:hypothetical protein